MAQLIVPYAGLITEQTRYHVIVTHDATPLGIHRRSTPTGNSYTSKDDAMAHASRLHKQGLKPGHHFHILADDKPSPGKTAGGENCHWVTMDGHHVCLPDK